MKKTLIVLCLVVVIAVAGFFVGRYSMTSTAPASAPIVATVPFTTIAAGSESTVTSRTNYLITSQAELNQLWTFLKKPPPVPTIDFTTEVVAAVFAGQFPTAGYGIAVAAVEDATERIVKVDITKPGQGCVLAQSTVTPYQIVVLPKTSLPFTHEDISTTKACN